MNFKVGSLFAKKYQIWGIPPDVGGMGRVLFVHPLGKPEEKLALKLCKDPANYARFKREVLLLRKYEGNSKVIQILTHSLDTDPPYFTMPYASKGDVYSKIERIKDNHEFQEKVFYRLIDAVAELHALGDIHRDLKPQNFLILEDGRVVVSDFGLAKLGDSGTVFTKTIDFAGTVEYAPPEFYNPGGFKGATIQWDIYSLGKTFYRLSTDRYAQHITGDGIPPSLYHVIKKCCELKPEARYKSLADLRQALSGAFDIILNRIDAGAEFIQLFERTKKSLEKGTVDTKELKKILETLPTLDDDTQIYFANEITDDFLGALSMIAKLSDHVESVLTAYEKMLNQKETLNFSYEFAEVVAREMKVLFDSPHVKSSDKLQALKFAMTWSVKCNRFAAMDACAEMIKSVDDEELGFMIAGLLDDFASEGFVTAIEPTACKTSSIRKKIRELASKKEEDDWF